MVFRYRMGTGGSYRGGFNMDITVVAVGRIGEKSIASGIDWFQNRLKRYCRLRIIEVPDCGAPENLSPPQLEVIKDREGEGILKHIMPAHHVIVLDMRGKKMASSKMARYIRELDLDGVQGMVFVIGGSNGLSRRVMERADLLLSFSDMTFPHQLMRLILLEQIYRWFKPVTL